MTRNNIKYTISYIHSLSKYYWHEQGKLMKDIEIMSNLMVTKKDLHLMREQEDIEEYKDICYYKGGKVNCLNLLNENDILKPSLKAYLNEDIKTLIESVAGYKQENIDYLHKIILYKYTHINDHTIPALVMYGVGGSGKGTLVSLLETIFGYNNVLANLGQREITSNFDTYTGKKLVVSFDEIITNNTHGDKQILNKLKNLIGAEKITVNQKGINQYQVENIAWFLISSNGDIPIQLDDSSKGNRRFSFVKSTKKLIDGESINNTIKNKEIVSSYIAWLYENYSEVIDYKKIEALDNEDKKEVEELSQDEANSFWNWVIDNHIDMFTDDGKMTLECINNLQDNYCILIGFKEYEFKKYFWKNSRYIKKRIRISGESHLYYGIQIPQDEWDKIRPATIKDAQDIFS